MNKWVLIGCGLILAVPAAVYGPYLPPEAITGLSLVAVGLAMTGE